MSYTTPNIDRIANEGIRFLHYYGEQSCTAGRVPHRAARHPHGADQGRLSRRADGAEPARPDGRRRPQEPRLRIGQFGKNHVGDRNETLPTVNGFDEFFGNKLHDAVARTSSVAVQSPASAREEGSGATAGGRVAAARGAVGRCPGSGPRRLAATSDEFPPRSFPPSFNPANIMEQKLRTIRAERALREAFPMLPAAEGQEN